VARELGDQVLMVADIDVTRAQGVAAEIGCAWTADWQEVVARDDVDLVVVSTVNKALAPAGETTVVFRDSAFAGDVAKTNLAAILQQHGLENVRSL